MNILTVRREWDDRNRSAKIPFSALLEPHWEIAGGQPFIYGYALCDQILEGDIGHVCDREKGFPHRLKLCVVKKR